MNTKKLTDDIRIRGSRLLVECDQVLKEARKSGEKENRENKINKQVNAVLKYKETACR